VDGFLTLIAAQKAARDALRVHGQHCSVFKCTIMLNVEEV
jgi:hypothetical protein